MLKTRFEIDCENLDYYFAQQIPFITPQAKEEIPKDVTFKLFRKGGEFNPKNTSKLGFIAKLFILWRCLRKRWYVVIEDEKEGLTIEQFVKWHEEARKRDYSAPKAEGMISTGNFVLGAKEVCDTFAHLNKLGNSSAYNYLVKGKNKIPNHTKDWVTRMEYICRFIQCYEAHKKVWVSELGISIPEWYVLISLYHGKESLLAPIYNHTFKRAYQSSPTKIRKCFSVLEGKGYITKIGKTRDAKIIITPLGKDVVNSILTKYALNC